MTSARRLPHGHCWFRAHGLRVSDWAHTPLAPAARAPSPVRPAPSAVVFVSFVAGLDFVVPRPSPHFAVEKAPSRGRTNASLHAACLYIACRQARSAAHTWRSPFAQFLPVRCDSRKPRSRRPARAQASSRPRAAPPPRPPHRTQHLRSTSGGRSARFAARRPTQRRRRSAGPTRLCTSAEPPPPLPLSLVHAHRRVSARAVCSLRVGKATRPLAASLPLNPHR